MTKITVLSLYDRISCYHSLTPFLFCAGEFEFTFTGSADFCLRRDKNEVLILMRQFIKPDVIDFDLLGKLRARYRRIAYFHDDAGGAIPRLGVLPYVDLLYHKALFRDRSLYKRPIEGKELYSEYFRRHFGVVDPPGNARAVARDDAELAKLRLSWNVGVGDFPRAKFRQRAGVAFARAFGPRLAKLFYAPGTSPLELPPLPARGPALRARSIDLHARLGMNGTPSLIEQRKQLLDRLEQLRSRFNVATGPVAQRLYNRELLESRLVLSPFGWGEVCLRDFEAVRAGAVLVKPDMAHLETWPDIFEAGRTYLPIAWDGSDLPEVVENVLSRPAIGEDLVHRAREAYEVALRDLPRRFASAMREIAGVPE